MISVIIPTADRPGPLHRALRSLARQTFRNFEAIVVRDAGPPVRSVVDSWKPDLALTLIDIEPRQGVSHARNTGLAAARGEYVAFLDDDDIFLPGHLEAAHHALKDGRADAVYGGALVSPRWIEDLPRDDPGSLQRKDYVFNDAYLLVANYVHTGSIVARNFSSTTARFDEEMTHCEDWDLWLTLRRMAGYDFAFLGDITCVYHQLQRPSAVSSAYLTSPTPFTRARSHLYGKWPTSDPLVVAYREWFRRFDTRLDSHIDHGRPVPPHVYERAVRGLRSGFLASAPPSAQLLADLLPAAEPTGTLAGRPEGQPLGVVHAAR
ncbi:glycosyltransferase family 2 protein (plasmid) [Streptomyces sp. HU2014]|uniref:glycosyltransferase family 2 protein n=1 Tax=Streptomyces sp. HU2014 TaxID=2939414 RepID=UPI00200D9498|nr:glycosyltransferase family A protein [Streptomyces sp. HU2014]UQI49675.1 glycosyltransferase family 2 protein [Streptomyces sp. HU2014]